MAGRTPAARDRAIDIALAEYAALRAEIDRRSQAQQTLANLALTLTGAVVAFAITNDAIGILLLQPIVASSLGMLYADHGAAIRRLGRYLDHRTGRTLRSAVSDQRLMRWEGLAARREGFWRPFWLMPPILVFVASSVVVLLASLGGRIFPTVASDSRLLHVPLWAFVVLWFAGLALAFLGAVAFYGAYFPPLTGFDDAFDAALAEDCDEDD